jgi:hypothetical protein
VLSTAGECYLPYCFSLCSINLASVNHYLPCLCFSLFNQSRFWQSLLALPLLLFIHSISLLSIITCLAFATGSIMLAFVFNHYLPFRCYHLPFRCYLTLTYSCQSLLAFPLLLNTHLLFFPLFVLYAFAAEGGGGGGGNREK